MTVPFVFWLARSKVGGTPIAGHKDNHGGLMTKAQMAQWQQHMCVPEGQEWDPLATVEDTAGFKGFLADTPFFANGPRRFVDDGLSVPAIDVSSDRETSTQMGFGKILDALSKGNSDLADRIVTTSPDVTGTTNLGAWVNRRKLFAHIGMGKDMTDHSLSRPL